MSQTIEIYLCIFLTVTAVLFIMISVFLVKFILELSKLTNTLNDIMTVIKSDLEPTLKEFQTTLKRMNTIISDAESKMSYFKGIASKLLGAGSLAVASVKGVTGSFWKGMTAGMKLFKK